MQEKAVFVEKGTHQIKAAKLPTHPLPKIIASVELLSFIIVSKYCDGLPLYRLENILKRYGREISRTSIAN
ncbi:MAG: transposase [Endozoicomonadaceae bacterium]|nr:transposase [Endozoicomonadaceae bacterium]